MKNFTMLTLASIAAAMTVGCGGGGTKIDAGTAKNALPAPSLQASETSATAMPIAQMPAQNADAAPASTEEPSTDAATRAAPLAGNSLTLIQMAPTSFGWGQNVQFGWQVAANGKPVKNASVRFWVSGHHGNKSGSWYATTGADGKVFKTATMPSNNANYYEWLDLNATVDQYGLSFFKSHIKG